MGVIVAMPATSDRHGNGLDRIDRVLVQRGYFSSRAAAQAAIAADRVRVNGVMIAKASEKVAANADISAEPAHPYVSRAGQKLAHALDQFGIDPAGQHCLDIGASTGGFSQVLLLNNALSVTAIDVGHGQLHPSLAEDDRLRSFEKLDARNLQSHHFMAPPSLLVCDASFISLSKLLAVPLSLARKDAVLIALFKPQFEVGRGAVGKGGIVSDQLAIERAQTDFKTWLQSSGWELLQTSPSPISGGDGNRETLMLARRLPE